MFAQHRRSISYPTENCWRNPDLHSRFTSLRRTLDLTTTSTSLTSLSARNPPKNGAVEGHANAFPRAAFQCYSSYPAMVADTFSVGDEVSAGREKMGSRRFSHSMSKVLTISAAVAILACAAWAAGVPQIIYSFAGGNDGEYIDSDLVIDGAGSLYGTSVQGGDFGSGTVFRLTPSANGWTHTVLYSFTGGTDGGEPYKGVTLDSQGNLYGTAVTGGGGSCEGGCGVAYKLTNSGGVWTQTVIHTFTGGDDGSGPGSGLTLGSRGALYGMTPTGGVNGLGVVFKLIPMQNGAWNLKVIHAFTGGDDGAGGLGRPLASL